MGCRILHDESQARACLFDSITETAFGPVFGRYRDQMLDASETAELFIAWTEKKGFRDPRSMTAEDLSTCYSELVTWIEKHEKPIADSIEEMKEALRAG